MRATRTFRWIWRVNAVFILLVALAALYGIGSYFVSEWVNRNRRSAEVQAAPVVMQADASASLRLGPPSMIAGTGFMRADLLRTVGEGKVGSFSSSDSTETRNVLFIDAASGVSRWLLPSHLRVIEQPEEIETPYVAGQDREHLATAVLVRDSGADAGDLVVFNPVGTKVVTVAGGVRRIHSATATGPSQFVVVFERESKYVLARFDATSFTRVSETELQVPQLP
jgi:hypothetical protein